MIFNQVLPGQEEGNARLVEEAGGGVVAEKNREAAANGWRRRLRRTDGFGGAGGKIWPKFPGRTLPSAWPNWPWANASGRAGQPAAQTFPGAGPPRPRPALPSGGLAKARMLLCDFHIHTNYSDGKLTGAGGG